MPHKQLNSKADFDGALQTKDKYVFIYAYEGEIPTAAEESSKKFESTTDAYAVEVSKHAAAKEYFKITTTPTALIFKDGKEVKRVDDLSDANQMSEVSALLGA